LRGQHVRLLQGPSDQVPTLHAHALGCGHRHGRGLFKAGEAQCRSPRREWPRAPRAAHSL
jgi:hypothetical protein